MGFIEARRGAETVDGGPEVLPPETDSLSLVITSRIVLVVFVLDGCV
jgi:hypothetical protein